MARQLASDRAADPAIAMLAVLVILFTKMPVEVQNVIAAAPVLKAMADYLSGRPTS